MRTPEIVRNLVMAGGLAFGGGLLGACTVPDGGGGHVSVNGGKNTLELTYFPPDPPPGRVDAWGIVFEAPGRFSVRHEDKTTPMSIDPPDDQGWQVGVGPSYNENGDLVFDTSLLTPGP